MAWWGPALLAYLQLWMDLDLNASRYWCLLIFHCLNIMSVRGVQPSDTVTWHHRKCGRPHSQASTLLRLNTSSPEVSLELFFSFPLALPTCIWSSRRSSGQTSGVWNSLQATVRGCDFEASLSSNCCCLSGFILKTLGGNSCLFFHPVDQNCTAVSGHHPVITSHWEATLCGFLVTLLYLLLYSS